MMNTVTNHGNIHKSQRAFTLIEIITVITIATIIMIAAIQIYGRVRDTANSLNERLDKHTLTNEILQRIAEDLDYMATAGYNVTVSVKNKTKNNFNISQLVIQSKYYGADSGAAPKPHIYERIVWQTDYDPFSDSLMLYRSHSGLQLEDPMLDVDLEGRPRDDLGKFVPLCLGITYFDIQIPSGEKFLPVWNKSTLPRAVTITISTATPIEDEFGDMVIPENELLTRTIAIDRTRDIRFKFVKKDFDMDDFDSYDPNEPDEPGMFDQAGNPQDEFGSEVDTETGTETETETGTEIQRIGDLPRPSRTIRK